MLEHVGECHDFPAVSAVVVADNLVQVVVSGNHVFQRAVLGSILNAQFLDVESVVDTEIGVHIRHIESVELRLGVAQGKVECACLEHIVGVAGRKAQSQSAVYDIFAQSDGYFSHAVFRLFIVDRVVVQ